MRLIDKLDEMQESGDLKLLIDSGLIKENIISWVSLFHSYIFELEQTKSVMQAMENVSCNFKVSVGLIEKIRRKFEG